MVRTAAPKTGPQVLGMSTTHIPHQPPAMIGIFSSSEKLKLYWAVLKHFFSFKYIICQNILSFMKLLSNSYFLYLQVIRPSQTDTDHNPKWHTEWLEMSVLKMPAPLYTYQWHLFFMDKKIRSFTYSFTSGNKMNVLIFAHSI